MHGSRRGRSLRLLLCRNRCFRPSDSGESDEEHFPWCVTAPGDFFRHVGPSPDGTIGRSPAGIAGRLGAARRSARGASPYWRISTRLRPLRLAWYSAASALCTSAAAPAPASGTLAATPMLTLIG
jgi:hypothetical protein